MVQSGDDVIGLLILATVITAACTPAGLYFVQRLGTSLNRRSDRFLASTWIGLVLLATLLMTAALVVPLTPGVGLLVAATATSAALSRSAVRQEIKAWLRTGSLWGLWLTAVSAGGILGIRPVVLHDTGLYHYQTIRWLSEYGTVRGLALIHERFGFASSYFALHAPLDSGL